MSNTKHKRHSINVTINEDLNNFQKHRLKNLEKYEEGEDGPPTN